MSSLSQNLSVLWQFLWVKVRWYLNFSKFWNFEISLNFLGFFCIWAQFLNIYNLCIATWGLKKLLPRFPDTPLAWDKIDTPLGNRVKSNLFFVRLKHLKPAFKNLKIRSPHLHLGSNKYEYFGQNGIYKKMNNFFW